MIHWRYLSLSSLNGILCQPILRHLRFGRRFPQLNSSKVRTLRTSPPDTELDELSAASPPAEHLPYLNWYLITDCYYALTVNIPIVPFSLMLLFVSFKATCQKFLIFFSFHLCVPLASILVRWTYRILKSSRPCRLNTVCFIAFFFYVNPLFLSSLFFIPLPLGQHVDVDSCPIPLLVNKSSWFLNYG